MRLLLIVSALLAVTLGQVTSEDSCDNDNGWYKQGTSCYKFYTTPVDEWANSNNCPGGAILAELSGAAENNLLSTQHNALVQAEGGSGVYTTYSNDVNYYWIGGQSNGWISGENFDLTCGNACFHSDNLGVDGDGNNVLTIDNAQKTLAWQTTSGLWSFRTHTLQYGKICEYVLDACTAGEDSRITWEEVAKDSYGTEDCPDGYSGTADRYCSAGLAFQTTDTTTCEALVSTSGYSHLADGDIDGSSQYNNLDDAFGWSGFGAVDIDVGVGLLGTSGSDYKKLFILDGVDTTAYTYVKAEFGIMSGDFEGAFEFEVDDQPVANTRAGNTVSAGESTSVWMLFPLEALADPTLAFEITIRGAGSGSYHITSIDITPQTRQLMAESCFRTMAFNESTAYPEFMKADSGFLSASDDITFTFSVPRELYNVDIKFEGQVVEHSNIGFDGNYSASLWEYDGMTATDGSGNMDSCAAETWHADVPWTSMDGVFTSVESFSLNSTTTEDNENEDYYVFIATMNITANEKLVAISDLSPRTWTLERTMHWKYPFALKWQRDISVTSDLEVHVCTDAQTICTIRHVTAIISYIQTKINPIADLAGNDGVHGVVTVGIKTLVAYPYMFINNYDPEFQDQALDQITNSSLSGYTYNNAVSGWVAEVAYAPADNEDSPGTPLEVSANVTWTHEDVDSCTHDQTQSVNQQADMECSQSWALSISPKTGSCFIDGNYTITWSARCFYDKPVCNFPEASDSSGYNNYVSSTLELKSTRMCPSLVQDVDLSGSLCSTGLAIEGANYLSGCDTDPTYIQGESTHFFAEVDSSLAAIIKTEVTNIQFSQTYWWLDPSASVSSELVPRYDAQYNTGSQYMSLWTLAGGETALTFEDQNNVTSTVDDDLTVVEDVQDSDGCQWVSEGSCSDVGFASTQAGFRIKLNSFIFPAPHDYATDINFRVVLRTTYEGFGNFDLTEGVLDGDQLGGTCDQSWCSPTLANDYDGDDNAFCNYHPSGVDNLMAMCPSICDPSSACRRRRLFNKETRRNLQQEGSAIPIDDGSDESVLATTIVLKSAKAEINGHVDPDASQVNILLSMIVSDDMLEQYNTKRPTFYELMEYHLGIVLGALQGQLVVDQIVRVDHGNQPALEVSAQLKQMDGLGEEFLPSALAARLELLVQTGKLYEDEFFHLAAVYHMEYQQLDETPNKIHFGQVDPVEEIPDDSVYTMSLALVCVLFCLLF